MNQFAMTPRSTLLIAAATLAGAIGGWLLGQSMPWTAVGGVGGAGIAAMVVLVGVRPIVAVPVGIGAGIGAYVGGTIVGVICEPQGCAAFAATAGVITGIGALVGIGLVVALATRSFDEYRAAAAKGVDPPVTACRPDDPEDSD